MSDRETPIPLVRLPLASRPALPPNPDAADYARAWASTCATYEQIIRRTVGPPAWMVAFLLLDTGLLMALVSYSVCFHAGMCR